MGPRLSPGNCVDVIATKRKSPPAQAYILPLEGLLIALPRLGHFFDRDGIEERHLRA